MPTTTHSFAHVTNRLIQHALEADPATLAPELIRALADNAPIHAEIDLRDPDVPMSHAGPQRP